MAAIISGTEVYINKYISVSVRDCNKIARATPTCSRFSNIATQYWCIYSPTSE